MENCTKLTYCRRGLAFTDISSRFDNEISKHRSMKLQTCTRSQNFAWFRRWEAPVVCNNVVCCLHSDPKNCLKTSVFLQQISLKVINKLTRSSSVLNKADTKVSPDSDWVSECVHKANIQCRQPTVNVLCSTVEVASSNYLKKLLFKNILSDWLKPAYLKSLSEYVHGSYWMQTSKCKCFVQ
jgi:hypothetical protein